jgi:hypothetical protein
MCALAEAFDGEGIYFDHLTIPSSGTTPIANQPEVIHIAHISSADGTLLWEDIEHLGRRRIFEKADAKRLLCYTLAHRFESHAPRADSPLNCVSQHICDLPLS